MKSASKTVKIKKTPAQLLTSVYLCAAFILLPLVLHSAYYDVTRTKFMAFAVLSGVYVSAVLPFAIREKIRLDPVDGFALGFFGLLALTSALNGAWLAEGSRYQGFVSALLYAAVFFALRRWGQFGKNERTALLLGFSLCAAIAVAEFFGLDPVGTVKATPETQRMRFMSTVGNISFLSALTVLVFPAASALFLRAQSRGKAALYAALSLLFLTAAMVSRAESAVLGLLAALAVIPMLTPAEALRRYPMLLCLLCGYAFAFSRLAGLGLYPLSELTQALTSVYIIILCPVFAALYFLLKRTASGRLERMKRIYTIAFVIFIAALLLFLLLANTVLEDALGEGIARYAVIDDDWGTDRGLIWRSCLEYYGSLGIVNKLFGAGAGSIALWDSLHPMFDDAITDSAHNEYLTYLITVGLFGLAAYVGLLFTACRRGRAHILLPCAIAYAVQAAVNIAQPFTTPMFVMLLALVSGREMGEEPPSLLPQELSGSFIALFALGVLIISAQA